MARPIIIKHVGFEDLTNRTIDDTQVVKTFCDFFRACRLFHGYTVSFVPQIGKRQGRLVNIARLTGVPEGVRSEANRLIMSYDLEALTPRQIAVIPLGDWTIYHTPIAKYYDIAIGYGCFCVDGRLELDTLNEAIDLIEMCISLRKRATAIVDQPDIIQAHRQGGVNLDRRIGEIVHHAIAPNETLIFRLDDEKELFATVYSSSGSVLLIPKAQTPLWHCYNNGEIAVIQNVDDDYACRERFGSPIFAKEFVRNSSYKSLVIAPIVNEYGCMGIVACYFGRVNAISMTEVSVIRDVVSFTSSYYALRHEYSKANATAVENERIARLVRQALLIADVMHDGVDDLMSTAGWLESIKPRNTDDTKAIGSAKASLKNLIASAHLFKRFFSGSLKNPKSVTRVSLFDYNHGRMHSIPIRPVLQSISAKYANEFEAHKISCRVLCEADVSAYGVEASIRRAVENPIKNSLHFLSLKSHVRRQIILGAQVKSTQDPSGRLDTWCEVYVYDNGIGMEEEHLSDAFKPFKSGRGGMGLGLVITEAACEALGGWATISSEWGSWCRVTMYFPMSER